MSNIPTLAAGVASIAPSPGFKPAFRAEFPLDGLVFAPQARSDLGDLTDLVANIKLNGILQPPLIAEDGTVICGHRRVEAARRAGLATIPVMAYPTLSPVQVRLLQLTENIHRADMTEQDIHRECAALLAGGMKRGEIAAAMGVSPATVTRWLSPLECPPEAREAFQALKLSLGQCDKIRVSPEPLETMRLLLGGSTQAQAARKPRPARPDAPRSRKISVPLVGGAVVTVQGEEIGLEEALEAAGEAAKAMRAALAKGLNVRTAQAFWKDIAAAN